MPFINGKFYMNPTYGRALEHARARDAASNLESQQQDQGAKSSIKLDKDKFVRSMDENANKAPQGKCALYCRKGLEAGGLDTTGHPTDGKDYGPFLEKHGASAVPENNYMPQKGDIVVFNGNEAHPHGHIAVYDGKHWVSDFKQNDISPYRKETPPKTIYRFPDSN